MPGEAADHVAHGPTSQPYSPGAGTPPPELAGRDKQLYDMDVALQRLLLGRPAKSVMLSGLRGVGKAVLLNEFGAMAIRTGYIHEHVGAEGGARLAPLMAG